MRHISPLLTVLFAGCSDYELKEETSGGGVDADAHAPDIVVSPSVIDFGSLDVGEGLEVTNVITVRNDGDDDLHIMDTEIEVGDFFSMGAIGSILVPPGGYTELMVSFHPETASAVGDTISIDSDDPDSPTVQVELMGLGVAPVIKVDPYGYDFGTPYVGCERQLWLQISNAGNADLVIDDFLFTTGAADEVSFYANDDDFAYTTSEEETLNGSLPWTLGPSDDPVTVLVNYGPINEYIDSAFVTIYSNDPASPEFIADQVGNGRFAAENLDLFEQPTTSPTDIIFAIDKSCSMDDNIANLNANMDTFVEVLSELDADYHVAAVVADNGCVAGGTLFIDNSFDADEAGEVMYDMIWTSSGYGGNTEKAFNLLSNAMAASYGGCNGNEGDSDALLRENSKLNLVGLSDEPEQSGIPVTTFVANMQAYRDDPEDVVIHAIGGPMTGCPAAEPYRNMYEAVLATGGTFLSICAEDWGASLEALAESSIADQRDYVLSEEPVPETISVQVDGIYRSSGWTYDEASNSIIFDVDHIPEPGSTIEVDYALYGECDS